MKALPESNVPLLVLGAGPAGLAAAEAASAGGQPLTLVDENAHAGGQIWRGGPDQWSDPRAHALWAALRARPHVRILNGARVVAAAGPNELLLETADGARKVRWERLVLCSGARELVLPFPGWTLPGVTGAGGLQALIKGGMDVSGKRVVVAGTGPLLLAVAETARRNGAQVLTIAEQRGTAELAMFFARLALGHGGKLMQSFKLMRELEGVRYRHGATVVSASGEGRLQRVRIEHGARTLDLECDFLACGFGLVPNLELASLLGCAVRDGKVVADGAQRTSRGQVWVAGESTGIGGVDKALAEGRLAGLQASGQAPQARDTAALARANRFAALLERSFAPSPQLRKLCKPDTLLCRCEDVNAGQLSGYPDWRTAKLMTRAGMGACQGRICGAACQFLYGWDSPGLRQPVFPTSTLTLACGTAAAINQDQNS